MATRDFDPLRLEVQAFAKEAGQLGGRWPLLQLVRLAHSALDDGGTNRHDAEVAWSAQGEQRAAPGGEPQIWLHLKATSAVSLECQRCLQPMVVPLHVDRRLFFVEGEDAAAALDTDSEDDVLTLEPAIDLRALLEDELILALPLVPRHEVCAEPLPLHEPDDAPASEHPFAALAALKRRPGSA